MDSEVATTPLGQIADFKNGKALPKALIRDAGRCTVYGSNGPIGRTNECLFDDPVSVVGRVGAFAGAVHRTDGPSWVSDNAIVARPKGDTDARYLFYLLGRLNLGRTAIGSAQPLVTQSGLSVVRAPICSLARQRAIASILGTLDDRIELNRKMSRTLDETAQAIFASMELSASWTDASIYEITDVVYGAPFSSKLFATEPGGMGVIRIRDISSGKTSVFTCEVHPRAATILPGDVVVGMDGEFLVEHWMGEPALLNQRVCHLRPRPGVSRAFVAFATRESIRFFERAKTGTTVVHLGKADIDTINVKKPAPADMELLSLILDPMLDRRVSLAANSRTLVALRDALLPRLLSGELPIPDAEMVVEEGCVDATCMDV